MGYFIENPDHLWFLIAGISFVIELGVMGLSGPLLFFGIASLFTGILVSLGILGSWQSEIFSVGIFSALITWILWKPLKAFQNTKSNTDGSSDMIGLQVMATSEISAHGGTIRYSGINWQARLADGKNMAIVNEQSLCQIVAVIGNTMLVKSL